MKVFCIDSQNEIINIPSGVYLYYETEKDNMTQTGGERLPCPDGATQIPVMLPPFKGESDDFSYPEDFRGLMINNLICQIKDVYRNMGENPPPEVNIDGFGKPEGNFDLQEYEY